ncbi:MAG: hypothetical protein AAB425_07290 [Bdellovibrionota bacterium]
MFPPELQEAINDQDQVRVRKFARAYLRSKSGSVQSPGSPAHRAALLLAPSLEILGMYDDLYRLLGMNNARTLMRDPARVSFAAVVWGRLGIYSKAIRLADTFLASNAAEYVRQCLCYLHCYELEQTVEMVNQAFSKNPPHVYSDTDLHRLAIAGAYAEIKRWNPAKAEQFLDRARNLKNAHETINQTRILRASGHVDRQLARFDEALRKYDRSYILTPDEPGSLFWALLTQYRAECLAALKGPDAARPLLAESYAALRTLHAHPVYWIENLLAQIKAGLLDPSKTVSVLQYPGLPNGFRFHFARHLGIATKTPPPLDRLTAVAELDEYYDFRNQHWQHGLTLEQKLATLALAAGEWGLETEHLRSLLWPDEPFAQRLQQQRLRQLLTRVRKLDLFGLGAKWAIDVDEQMVRLSASNPTMVRGLSVIEFAETQPRASFFIPKAGPNATARDFQRADVENHYRTSKAGANRIIKHWMESAWLETLGTGKATHYRGKINEGVGGPRKFRQPLR